MKITISILDFFSKGSYTGWRSGRYLYQVEAIDPEEILMAAIWLNLYTLIFGLCIGSFLNVCIHRLPLEQSIVHPPSACPHCNTRIRWYDNLPVISFLLLRGRCRGCKAPISIRYPLVELLTGMAALSVFLRFGLTWSALIYFIFIAALLVITFIDIDHRIIPDVISLPGIPLGFAASFVLPRLAWSDSLLGILIGGGILLAIAWGYRLITGKDGMGGGDIKLLAMIGAFLGWRGVLFTVMASSFIGTVVGLTLMIRAGKGMKLAIPFGPFLALGAICYLFFGPAVISWYLYDFLR
jgi:leader peptidase (prepilin peptidase) / N-methyltransferase